MHQKKIAAFNSLVRICLMVLMSILFSRITAAVAGDVLFGGAIDNCKLAPGLDSYSSGEVFDKIVYNQ